MVIYSLYPSHTCMFVCIGTLIPELSLTLAIYFMRWNFLKHATKWRCHKRKKNNNTFDHLALGVHNIFISYFFPHFFSLFLFSSYFRVHILHWHVMLVGMRMNLYWSKHSTCSTWNAMISSLSYAYILYGVRSYGLFCTVVGVSIRHSCACVFMFR